MTVFTDYKQALVEAGFEDTTTLIYNIFDGDETPEHETLSWREHDKIKELLQEVDKRFGFEHMECEGGGEGEGEYCYGVIRLSDKYFKAEWSYYSYNGCEYDYIEDTIKEVTPREKTITVYE